MQSCLPENHSLSPAILKSLVFSENDQPSLTEVQFAALEAGVGRGESILVVSPTSTGKTQVALWAIASSLERGANTVYLVTHKALAKQKFVDFKSLLLAPFLDGDASGLVIATGDYVEDAEGQAPKEPLNAPLLVAAYEKYLAMLSASGVPTDMRSTTVVCDEIQLIGDEHRGRNVELLLTLLRNAGWKQFVGLSAVLDPRDAKDLAQWLDVKTVLQHAREKHLRYECWTPTGIAGVTSDFPENVDEGLALPQGVAAKPLDILAYLLRDSKPPVPIIVFCMRKRDTYDLASQFVSRLQSPPNQQLSLAFDGLPETAANAFLSRTFGHRVASHSADLIEEERSVVENHLMDSKIDVVFATTTLAAGVNFPFGAAIFAGWQRWDSDRKVHVPIDSAEFHNMAGRVGRMGFGHERGRIIFTAETTRESRAARIYLALDALPSLEPRISEDRFNQIALQSVSSGLCSSKAEVHTLVCGTFSAQRKQERNPVGFARWAELLSGAIDELIEEGFLLLSSAGRLSATPVGKALGFSGLLPETGALLLRYVAAKADRLAVCLPTETVPGDTSRLAFLLFSSCLSSAEFRPSNRKPPTRFLPYPLTGPALLDADPYRDDLIEPVWQADLMPINGAALCVDWIDGKDIRDLEHSLPSLSAGMLRELFGNVAWAIQGLAAVVAAAADQRVPMTSRPKAIRKEGATLVALGKPPRVMRRLGYRLSEGLPDDVLWMTGLNSADSEYRLARGEILSLRKGGYRTPEMVMRGSPADDAARCQAFAKAKPSPVVKANWLRDSCRNWKSTQRRRTADRHLRRAQRCARVDVIKNYYGSTGNAFEKAFEVALSTLGVSYDRLDDKTRTGAPDYLVRLQDSPPLIVELKSKQSERLVDYNSAVEVLAASEIHGHKDVFCLTLCHPGVDPSVPLAVAACGRLAVVESTDFGEALLRLCEGVLTQKQLFQWLTTPGQALVADLPFREYGSVPEKAR